MYKGSILLRPSGRDFRTDKKSMHSKENYPKKKDPVNRLSPYGAIVYNTDISLMFNLCMQSFCSKMGSVAE